MLAIPNPQQRKQGGREDAGHPASFAGGVLAFGPEPPQKRSRHYRFEQLTGKTKPSRCTLPKELFSQSRTPFRNRKTAATTPISSTRVRMLPRLPASYEYDDSVVFYQRSTDTRISGREELERSIRRWETDFEEEVCGGGGGGGWDRNNNNNAVDGNDPMRSVRLQTSVATTVSPTTLLVRWNATYVDPTVRWLASLADAVPGWTADYRSYVDKASETRTFSYTAFVRLFTDAFATGKFKVPLACIEGTLTCEFAEGGDGASSSTSTSSGTKKIRSIVEDLAYAQDLNRGALGNRICARDLQFFLEVARKPHEYSETKKTNNADGNNSSSSNNNNNNADSRNGDRDEGDGLYWEDRVASSLPWRSVPGMMDPMYIEAQSEEDIAANVPLIFGMVSVVAVVLFANAVAPALIGQSLFGSLNYIVPPSELNDIIGY